MTSGHFSARLLPANTACSIGPLPSESDGAREVGAEVVGMDRPAHEGTAATSPLAFIRISSTGAAEVRPTAGAEKKRSTTRVG